MSHTHESAALLAPSTHLDVAVLDEVQRRAQPQDGRYIGLHPVDTQVIELEQAVADNLTRIGLLPGKVDVRAGLLSPQEVAAVTPDRLLSSPVSAPNATPIKGDQKDAPKGQQIGTTKTPKGVNP